MLSIIGRTWNSIIGGRDLGTHRIIIYKVKQSCIELTSPCVGMELTVLVAMDTDWIGTSSKFIYDQGHDLQ
jgi:hypothetical protein